MLGCSTTLKNLILTSNTSLDNAEEMDRLYYDIENLGR